MAEDYCGANVRGSVVSLAGCLCSLRYVRCVPFLSLINQTVADHDTWGCGPQHEMRSVFVASWGKEGIIIFL